MKKSTTYYYLWQLLTHQLFNFIISLIASLVSALSEGMGVGVIILLLQNAPSISTTLGQIPGLEWAEQFLTTLTVVERIRLAGIILIVTMLARMVTFYVSRLLAVKLTINIERNMHLLIFRQLTEVQLSFIYKERLGSLAAILNYYTRQIGQLIRIFTTSLVDLLTIIVYVVLLGTVSWPLTLLVGIIFCSISYGIRRFTASAVKEAGQQVNQAAKELSAIGLESLSAMKLIHLFSQEGLILARFAAAVEHYTICQDRLNRLTILNRPMFMMVSTVMMGVLMLAGTVLLPGPAETWLGSIILFIIVAFRLMSPLAQLNDSTSQIQGLLPAVSTVFEFLNRQDKPYIQDGSAPLEQFRNKLTLENITYRYQTEAPPVLDQVSLTIPKGQMTAIVGPSGAGKTTLINLIARLDDCESGRILVDGLDLRQLKLSTWRSKIAVVSQDVFLFHDTVADNLKFAQPTATKSEVIRAAQMACAHDFIMALPQGYETLVGDRGVRLSGGQQQRLAIARAFLAAPQLLILDEPTSQLDSETERAIQVAMDQLSDNCTLLVVAHRLSTIAQADQIIVLAEGRVIEQGTHQQLIQRNGYYAHMVITQTLQPVAG